MIAVPGYATLRLLGIGAHCRVFLARDEAAGERFVALKIFEGRVGLAAHTREVAMLRRVEGVRRREGAAGLVRTHGSGRQDALGWIAFEYLEDGSLADRLARDGRLALPVAVDYALQAGRALAVLHRAGIFHRDVNPANLLLGADGVVRVADFGFSRAPEDAQFAAPEVCAGRPGDGRVSDVYSLAATLAYLLTVEATASGRIDPAALERHDVPEPLRRVLRIATAEAPDERYGTIGTFLQAVEAAAVRDPAPRLERLGRLLADGLIDRQDFDAARARILAE